MARGKKSSGRLRLWAKGRASMCPFPSMVKVTASAISPGSPAEPPWRLPMVSIPRRVIRGACASWREGLSWLPAVSIISMSRPPASRISTRASDSIVWAAAEGVEVSKMSPLTSSASGCSSLMMRAMSLSIFLCSGRRSQLMNVWPICQSDVWSIFIWYLFSGVSKLRIISELSKMYLLN